MSAMHYLVVHLQVEFAGHFGILSFIHASDYATLIGPTRAINTAGMSELSYRGQPGWAKAQIGEFHLRVEFASFLYGP